MTKWYILSILAILNLSVKAQDPVGTITWSNDGSPSSSPGTVYGGDDPWANSDRHKRLEDEKAAAAQRYDQQLKLMRDKSNEYKTNSNNAFVKFTNSSVQAEIVTCPRLAKHIQSCLDDITNLNKSYSSEDQLTIAGKERKYETYSSAKTELDNEDGLYKQLYVDAKQAESIQKLDNDKQLPIQLKQDYETKEKLFSDRIAELQKLRLEAYKNALSTSPLLAVGMGSLITKGIANSTADIFLEEMPIAKPVYVFSQVFVEELTEKFIENDEPITSERMDEVYNKALFHAELAFIPATTEIEAFNSQIDLAEKAVKFYEDHDYMIKMQADVIDQIDNNIAVTKKMQKINREQYQNIAGGIQQYLKSTIDIQPIRVFTKFNIQNDDLTNPDFDLNLNLILWRGILVFPTKTEYLRAKEVSNNIFRISNKYEEVIKSQSLSLFPRFIQYTSAANESFKLIAGQNVLVQSDQGFGSSGTDVIAAYYQFIGACLAIKKDYSEGMNNLKKLEYCEEVFLDTIQMLNKIQEIVNARDTFYLNLVKKSGSFTNSVLPNTTSSTSKNLLSARKRAIAVIKEYLNYSGKDIFTGAFAEIRNLKQQGSMTSLPDVKFVSSYFSEAISEGKIYSSDILVKLFLTIEKETLDQLQIDFSKQSVKQNSKDELDAYLNLFEMARVNHKKIFTLIDSGKYAFLNGN